MRQCAVNARVGHLEGMGRAVVAIDALHFKVGSARAASGVAPVGEVSSRHAAAAAVLHPGDGLALFVRSRVANMDARAHVRAMNAAVRAAAHHASSRRSRCACWPHRP